MAGREDPSLSSAWSAILTFDVTGQQSLSPTSPPRTPRNFDEVVSCFANVPREVPLFSKAYTSLYCEEDSKVGVRAGVIC